MSKTTIYTIFIMLTNFIIEAAKFRGSRINGDGGKTGGETPTTLAIIIGVTIIVTPFYDLCFLLQLLQ